MFSSFLTMFTTSKPNFVVLATFKVAPANGLNLDESKIFSVGQELKQELNVNFLQQNPDF